EAGNDCEGNWGWLTTMLNSIGSTIDGVEYHDYIFYPDNCPGDNPSNAWYWQIMYDVVSRDFGAHIRNNVIPAMNSANPDGRIKLVVDEWGDWLIDEGDGWMQQVILMDAISAGMHLHVMMPHARRITVACLAQGVNVIHSLINISNNSSAVMVKTPVFYVFKMFIPHHTNGAKWCPISTSSIQTTTQTTQNNGSVTMPVLTVGATVDNSQYVNVSFTNMDISATRQAVVTLTSSQPSYTVASAQVVTGSAINATNNFSAAESVNMQTLSSSNYTMNVKTLTVTLPARSVVMFRLQPAVAVRPPAVQTKAGDAFLIKAGPRGTVLITSSVSHETPVTVSLYGVDGRTLVESFTGSFETGRKTLVWQPKSRVSRGTNVYIVRLKSGEVSISRRVVLDR
ncbi:MAG: hypothetical protein JW699_07650, partial [Chitinispirillaceae bacterium]|nr:hypothetical protein [Chitinispirillaceae bacterium]